MQRLSALFLRFIMVRPSPPLANGEMLLETVSTNGSSLQSVPWDAPAGSDPHVESVAVMVGNDEPRAEPMWFGESGAPLFGWFHRPASPGRGCAVILCNPFGYDAILSHYSYRHLAEQLAKGGFAVVRFDYLGTGDSSGEDDAPTHVDTWIRDIGAACEEARRRCPGCSIALFGLGLGGLLALVAAQRQPVDDLILVGPPASGRAFLRELRAVRALRSVSSRPTGVAEVSEDENFGFLMSRSMRDSLEGLDPKKSSARPAARVLVVPRDQTPGSEAGLVDHLKACGADAAIASTRGYDLALRGDAAARDLPDAAWDEARRWLQARHAALEGTVPVAHATTGASVSIDAVREEAVHFSGMFGILTEPAVPSVRSRTAVVLAVSGSNHRVGDNRMYVTWARRWAKLGFRVLRFDLSGIGDSPVQPGRREKEVYSPSHVRETGLALDFLQSRGCDRFIVGGICSGAYVAYHAGVDDPRICGILLVNLPTFHWKDGDSLELRIRHSFNSTNFYVSAALDWATWRRAMRRELHLRAIATELAGRAVAAGRSLGEDWLVRLGMMTEPNEVARGFRSIGTRGAESLLVYGPSDGGIDVLEKHLGRNARKMRDDRRFRVAFVEGADHTFTPRVAQERLLAVLTEHLLQRFA